MYFMVSARIAKHDREIDSIPVSSRILFIFFEKNLLFFYLTVYFSPFVP